MNTKLIPLTRRETRVYLPNVAGGFDLAGCPDAEILAALIVKAVNAHDQLVAALSQMVKRIEYYSSLAEGSRPNIEQWEYTEGSADMRKAREALAAAEGK